jgi:hypothetical protein
MSQTGMSLADALATLSPEVRAAIESQLKRTASAKQFQHVDYSQYYTEETVEGKVQNRPSGISNTNVLKISHDKKAFGKRNVAISVSRNRDGTLSISNAAFFPVSTVSLSKEGRLSLTLNDTFNAQEMQFITGWTKAKYTERPTAAQAATTEATSTEAPAPAAPATSVTVPDVKVVKVALIKAKVKPTDENVSLIGDIMTQTGASLSEAVTQLAA